MEQEHIALPPLPEQKHSGIGLMIALAIGLIALLVLIGMLLFRSRAGYGPENPRSPFYFGSPTATPSASSTPTPTPTPTPPTPSPSGNPHSITITDIGISQEFGGDTTNIITLTPGTLTTVYIQGSVSHTPSPPDCSVITVSYGATAVTPSCGFQIPTQLDYNAVCGATPEGNVTSWSISVAASDTDSGSSTTQSATVLIQC